MSSQGKSNRLDRKSGEIKRARRTRKDEEGRDYFCPCGKSYLSYPALYTHIKTKHDGKVSSFSCRLLKRLVWNMTRSRL